MGRCWLPGVSWGVYDTPVEAVETDTYINFKLCSIIIPFIKNERLVLVDHLHVRTYTKNILIAMKDLWTIYMYMYNDSSNTSRFND